MNDNAMKNLHNKLLEIMNQVKELKLKKKEFNASLSEHIKSKNMKIDHLVMAINSEDINLLKDAFDDYEIGDIISGTNKNV